MQITVTQEDILKGRRGECSLCPIALAISREVGHRKVYVGNDVVQIGDGKKWGVKKYIWLPKEAVMFIFHFDHRDFVEPFTFELDI